MKENMNREEMKEMAEKIDMELEHIWDIIRGKDKVTTDEMEIIKVHLSYIGVYNGRILGKY